MAIEILLGVAPMEEGRRGRSCGSLLPSVRKVVAEFIGTFFLIFVGCGSVVVDKISNGSITHLGVSLVWGMAAMIVIYSIGHISGAHLNPAVTLALAAVKRFPWVQVPGYIVAQVFGSISAGFLLRFMFGEVAFMGATVPSGSEMQSFALEIITTSLLVFVVSAVATDTKAVGELGGLAIGATIAMNVAISGPISGASMNPARTIGSAVAGNKYTSIWVYMVGPVIGALMGAMSYNMIRETKMSEREIMKSGSFVKDMGSSESTA
uniref:Early embryogenesis aquaglyceroporin n=1 Tax=Pinus taeda TaxID=3352 RepID=Q940D9_PINTA|nr:early embryogenesis aquaglyceroporin [Pinus taeda]